MTSFASTAHLPPEILSQIFDYLHSPTPSDSVLHEQPHGDMLRGDIASSENSSTHFSRPQSSLSTNLKSISRVSRQWRTIVLPSLFNSILWRPKMTSLSASNLDPAPMLRFLYETGLNRHVVTFTLVVDFTENDLEAVKRPHQTLPGDLELVWNRIFAVLDPLRFTIIAPPTTLATFLNRMLFLADAWSFDIPYHILSLARSTRGAKNGESEKSHLGVDLSKLSLTDTAERGKTLPGSASAGDSCHKEVLAPSPLFTLRPWTSILLNEGSSIRAYQTYEFFLRQPPSMLSALLGIGEYPNNEPLLPPSITDFNYIAIFPLASHVHTLLLHLPRLDRLFMQLAPRPSNRILQDQHAMRNIDMADLWMERNTAYSYLFAALTSGDSGSDSDSDDDHNNTGQQQRISRRGNWPMLRVFESGDAADKESWNMAVDFLKRSGVENWVVEREGVLIRTGGGDDDSDDGGDRAASAGAVAAMAVHHLLSEESLYRNPFQGAIRRIAFDGVAHLPYSSMLLYVQPEAALDPSPGDPVQET